MATKTKTSDIHSTRRRIRLAEYERNGALYATYNLIGYEDFDLNDKPRFVVLEKKAEFLKHKETQS